MLKNSRGQYAEAHVRRCSRLGGGFGREIDRMFHAAMFGYESYTKRPKHKPHYAHDVMQFVEEFRSDGLFDYFPPREHDAFPQYVDNSNRIKSPIRFGRHLVSLSEDIDYWRHRASRARRPDVPDNTTQ
jgi:hypothetical protein